MSSLPLALCKKKAEGKRSGEGSRRGEEGRREQISLLFPTILHSEVDVEAVILPQLISGDLKQNVKPARCTRAIGSLLIDWHPQETHRWTPSSWRTPPCEFLKSKPSFLCLLPAASHPTPPPHRLCPPLPSLPSSDWGVAGPHPAPPSPSCPGSDWQGAGSVAPTLGWP